jgi:acetylornithine deacetylase
MSADHWHCGRPGRSTEPAPMERGTGMTLNADRSYVRALLEELIATSSVNPAFGGPGEESAADLVTSRMAELGMEVSRHEPEPGRASVVGRLRGVRGGPSLMLYAHLDTVGVEGMEAPFEPHLEGGRMRGRGAYDMKGGLAACLAAAAALTGSATRLAGDLLVAAVADEEAESLGMREVLRHHRADGAVVTEPTGLDLCVAHKGFCWIEIVTLGRAAHGSRFDVGIDANLAMGVVLHRLDALERELRAREPHPLLGPPSLHVPILQGGTGSSTYAATCSARIERRTVPGESDADVLAEIDGVLAAARADRPGLAVERRIVVSRPTFAAAPRSMVEAAVDHAAAAVLGTRPRRTGAAFWMDAALIEEAGIPTVVIGPDGGGAHAPEEWVDLESVVRLASILAGTAVRFCGTEARP